MIKSTRARILSTTAVPRSALFAQALAGAAAFVVGASAAHADTIVVADTAYAVGQNQIITGSSPTVAVSASIASGASVITSGVVTDSTALTSLETYSTSVTGNFASSTLTSTINNDTIGIAVGTVTSKMDSARALAETTDASLAVTLAQDVVKVSGSSTQDSSIGLTTATLTRSTVSAADNLQESRGVLNVQDSTLNLAANATNTSGGIASSQSVENSTMDASANSTASISVTGLVSDVSSSTVSLTGNDQIAVAVGNSGANLISGTVNSAVALSSTGATKGATATPVTVSDPAEATATAGFGVSSNQVVDSTSIIGATVGSDNADGFLVTVGTDVLSSTVANDSNSALTSARGNENTNRITLSGNSLVTQDSKALPVSGSLAAVASTQELAGSVTATTLAGADNALRTNVTSDVTNSTVTTSSNLIDAAATGNRGANAIVVDANTIDTGAVTAFAQTFNGTKASAQASGGAALASSQLMTGTVGASLSELSLGGEGTSGAVVSVNVGDNVVSSTVRADSNRLQATAIGNQITSGTNSITVTGTTVSTSTTLANLQYLDGDVTADIGAAGSASGTPISSSVSGIVTAGIWEGNILTLSAAEKTGFLATVSSITGFTYNPVTGAVAFTSVGSGALTIPYTYTSAGTAGSGGVTIAIGDNITDSTVSVDGNSVAGSVTGNTANNVISVAATNLNLTSIAAGASNAAVGGNSAGSTLSDNNLANEQSINKSGLDTTVNNEFTIDGNLTAYDTTDSSLSVSDNAQSATTRGNVVTNSISLSATNAETGAALSSLQSSDTGSSVAATSTMSVTAPAGMTDSVLALDNNSNTADVAINTATNSVALTEGNVTSISNGVNVTLRSDDTATGPYIATADFVMFNEQTAEGTADATATTTIVNQEGSATPATDSDRVVNSSITADGNDTLARAIANTATNSMALGGNASFAATGGVINRQDSDAAVSADNITTVRFNIDSSTAVTPTTAVVDASSVSVSDNTAQTIARGNVATNSLTASALALDANPPTGGATPVIATASLGFNDPTTGADTGASASFAVLNSQLNSGAVIGTTTVSYSVALNGTGGSPTATLNASRVNVSNNLSQTSAAGNVASNTLTLTALNHGNTTGVIGNEQSNTGAITATVTNSTRSASFGAGAVASSAVAVTGGRTTATAVGNSATSVLIRN